MKNKIKGFVAIIICSGLMLSSSSCIVLSKHDNGRHRGAQKSTNKSHHPKKVAHPSNNGKGHHKKGKGHK